MMDPTLTVIVEGQIQTIHVMYKLLKEGFTSFDHSFKVNLMILLHSKLDIKDILRSPS